MSNISRFHFDKVYDNFMRIGDFILCQAGDLSCEAGYEVGVHEQWCHEITYVVSGKAKCIIDDKEYQIEKGDVHFCKKGEVHNIISDNTDPVRFLYFGINLIDDYTGEFDDIINYLSNLQERVVVDRFDISALFYQLLNELIFNRTYTQIALKNIIENLLVVTYREFAKEKNKVYARQNYKDSFVYDIMYYIDCNIRSITHLMLIAEEFGYSYNYISREFARVTGQNMKEYVLERKFEIAVNLILNSDKNITDIAEELSFSSIHSFSRAFKKHSGISPQQYRDKNVQ